MTMEAPVSKTSADVLERLEALGDVLDEEDGPSEELGRLTDRAAGALRESGVMRMLQPKSHGGFESTPAGFFRACMSVASRSGSAGWVTGVVGVHAFEIAQMSPKLLDEIWGEDQDTWLASPYAPSGVAVPVEGGYILNGRWAYSTGNDHSEWVHIGGWVAKADGENPRDDYRHFVLPKSDYEVLHDSWHVMGLQGTGSKDFVVKDAFVPEYRVLEQTEVLEGTLGPRLGLESPLYGIPRAILFSGAVSSSSLGIARGFLREFAPHLKARTQSRGGSFTEDPYILAAFGEAHADVEMGITQVLADADEVWQIAARREVVPLDVRLRIRRNRAHAVVRAVDACNRLYAHGGGSALDTHRPLQRRFRDLQAARSHAVNIVHPAWANWSRSELGLELPPELRG